MQIAAGQVHETVHLIDWDRPDQNDFELAEEVTLKGGYQRRPDIVLYLNGIAIAVLELKRSSVEAADGVRQIIVEKDAKPAVKIEEPANLKLLIVVSKLLTGFDAPSCRRGRLPASLSSARATTCGDAATC